MGTKAGNDMNDMTERVKAWDRYHKVKDDAVNALEGLSSFAYELGYGSVGDAVTSLTDDVETVIRALGHVMAMMFGDDPYSEDE